MKHDDSLQKFRVNEIGFVERPRAKSEEAISTSKGRNLCIYILSFHLSIVFFILFRDI